MNSNGNTCRVVASVIGIEKDPAGNRNINKNIENSVNDINDNNVSVVVVDSGFSPPSGVGNIIFSTDVDAGNVWPDVNDSHVASDEVVVAGHSPSAPPPPSGSEIEMVDASAVRKRSRPPALSDCESSGFAPSPEKRGRKKVSGSLEGPGCYPRRFLAGKLVPLLPQLNPVLLVFDNYEACFHFDYDGS